MRWDEYFRKRSINCGALISSFVIFVITSPLNYNNKLPEIINLIIISDEPKRKPTCARSGLGFGYMFKDG